MSSAVESPDPNAGTAPDIMNDPQFATNTTSGGDSNGDPDTCRICRGESVDGEPLFYPCKCSGSIKFVHQDCLMEWLSHSQKKHCELCKTPFRFTKLYSANMPQTLPTHVFLRHFAIHAAKNLASYLRFCLVALVWFLFVPWFTRVLWRFLFWFSDGGWPASKNTTNAHLLELAHELQVGNLVENGTSPATPLYAVQTSPAIVGGMMERLVSFLMPVSQTLNFTGSDPLTTGFLRFVLYGLGLTDAVNSDGLMNSTAPFSNPSNQMRRPTLLSEVSFLRDLTPISWINTAIIQISEGYIITILVVVSFILVFLIREWVVQQQPVINMAAAFGADMAAGDGARVREERPVEAAPIENQQPQDHIPHPNELDIHNEEAREERRIAEPHRRVDFDARPHARPRRRVGNHMRALGIRGLDEDERETEDVEPIGNQLLRTTNLTEEEVIDMGFPYERPIAATNPPSSPAVQMTEEFSAIWRRAGGDPREVLEIINREGLRDRMQYWADAMNARLQADELEPELSPPAFGSSSSSTTAQAESSIDSHSRLDSTDSDDSFTESEKEYQEYLMNVDLRPLRRKGVDTENLPLEVSNQLNEQSVSKGKGPLTSARQNLEPIFPQPRKHDQDIGVESTFAVFPESRTGTELNITEPHLPTSSSKRPRSISDVPHIRENKSPLAHNNWTFGNLQDTDVSDPNSNRPRDNKRLNDADVVHMARKAAEDLDLHHGVSADNGLGASQSEILLSPGDVQTHDPNHDGPLQTVDHDVIAQAIWDEFIEGNSFSGDEEDVTDEPEANPFAPDTHLPPARDPVVQQPRLAEPQGVLARITEWLWGDAEGAVQPEDLGANDEHVVQDVAAEAPFVPVVGPPARNGMGAFGDDDHEQDREVLEAAMAAGIDPNDPDVDEPEDFDGLMELIGMRGPIFGLVQNAIFSCLLLFLTVAVGVWIPYNIGRVALLLLANPGPALKLPLRFIFGCAAFLQDFGLMLLGLISYCLLFLAKLLPISSLVKTGSVQQEALKISQFAFGRVMNGTVESILHVTDSEMLSFSAASHESLMTLKSVISDVLASAGSLFSYLISGNITIESLWKSSVFLFGLALSFVSEIPSYLSRPESWVISLDVPKRLLPLNPDLSFWGGYDRCWATLTGYTVLSLVGALYVKRGVPFAPAGTIRDVEAVMIDLFNQAGGVMKVILIISIEMLVFPLYCGLLLDVALLPLFEGATVMSRLSFTARSPLTSIFVHWFVGTCYMFHFALFVSMCRKIMRKGVLYFIRDPDDPTFHPVRDVLERNVATQLRKILFSALVYGALVVICLGGVVWGLAFAFKDVLPIHWSSNEPVLEFPVDLLFYNFLMPLAVKFFKPSDGLHSMYNWWFRRCARMLRLTWFMFGDRRADEEGQIFRRTWKAYLEPIGENVYQIEAQQPDPFPIKPKVQVYVKRDGRYVRAPASDQVRLPKGSQVFLQVNEQNQRVDGKPDNFDGLHGRNLENYMMVYVPPWFRLRITLFILSVWFFAAATGVCITIVPLVFGRHIFAKFIPSDVRKNDVYAFSIGIYILGSLLYALIHLRSGLNRIRNSFYIDGDTPAKVLRRVGKVAARVARILWTYTAFIFILPTLFAFLIEFYFIVPLHTYFAADERHVVHFVQSWTLGLLYVKLTTRIILWHEGSRPAEALRAVTRNGYFDPDARLATRSFILPAGLVLSTALAMPYLLANLATSTIYRTVSEQELILVYRYAYPMVLLVCFMGATAWKALGVVHGWKQKIKDDVYLIGERLHNFGDNRKVVSGEIGGNVVRRIDT